MDDGSEEDRGSESAAEGEKSQGPVVAAPRRAPIGPAMPSATVLAQAQQAAAEFAQQVRRSRRRFISHRRPFFTRVGICLCGGVRGCARVFAPFGTMAVRQFAGDSETYVRVRPLLID